MRYPCKDVKSQMNKYVQSCIAIDSQSGNILCDVYAMSQRVDWLLLSPFSYLLYVSRALTFTDIWNAFRVEQDIAVYCTQWTSSVNLF